MNDPQEPLANIDLSEVPDDSNYNIIDQSMIDNAMSPIIRSPFMSRDRDILDQPSNSLYSTRYLDGSYKSIPNSPMFSMDIIHPNASSRPRDSLLSPQGQKEYAESNYNPHSFRFTEIPSSSNTNMSTNSASDNFITPAGNSNGSENTLFPGTPRMSAPSFPLLFYSPHRRYNPVDSNSDVSLQEMRLQLHPSPTELESARLDDSSWYSGMKLSSTNEEPKKEATVFHFATKEENETPSSVRSEEKEDKSFSDEDGSYSEDFEDDSSLTKSSHRFSTKRLSQKRVLGSINSTYDQENGVSSDIPVSSHPCNCKKSRCLKLYCECFSADVFCNGCNCSNCLNNPAHIKERDEAKQLLLERNADAFKPRMVKDSQSKTVNLKGCNCKKTGCIKKYCECFQSGIPCGENCHCIDCRNTDSSYQRTTRSDMGSIQEEGIDEDFNGSS